MLKFLKINLLAFFIGFSQVLKMAPETNETTTSLVNKYSDKFSIDYSNKIVNKLIKKINQFEPKLKLKTKKIIVFIEKCFIKHQQNISSL